MSLTVGPRETPQVPSNETYAAPTAQALTTTVDSASPPAPASTHESLLAADVRRFFGGWKPTPGLLPAQARPAPRSPAEVAMREAVRAERIMADVTALAAPALQGRENGTSGNAVGRARIVEAMRQAQLRPYFGDSYEQAVMSDDHQLGVNVAGYLPATGPNPNGDYIMIVAHHDHLGTDQHGRVFAGADDNASGVAEMLEVARVMAQASPARAYDIVFVAPDSEEPPDVRSERMGSSYLLAHSPRPVERLRTAIVLDVVGNDTALPGHFLLLGAEASPLTRKLVGQMADEDGARALLSSVSIAEKNLFPWQNRAKSDYYAVRAHGRPFVFLTAGTAPTYHRISDTPERLSADKMAKMTRYVASLALAASNAGGPTTFDGELADPAADLRALRAAVDLKRRNPPPGLRPEIAAELAKMPAAIDALERDLAAGTMSPARYSEVRSLGLQLMHVMTRPTQSTLSLAWEELRTSVLNFMRRLVGLKPVYPG